MLKAIIFDMDGLMVDTEIISFQCYKDIIESYGFNFTKKEYIEDYPGKSVISSIIPCLSATYSFGSKL